MAPLATAHPDAAVLAELDGLRALARSLVHGDAEADDLLQDAAIAAIEHPPATDRPVRPWLAAVLRNRRRMDVRGDGRRRAREDGAAPPELDAAPRADELLERARLLERLAQALVALDEPFRGTVIRRYLDGQTAAAIARADGVPAATVRWRLATGLERLRAAMDAAAPRRTWMRALMPAPIAGWASAGGGARAVATGGRRAAAEGGRHGAAAAKGAVLVQAKSKLVIAIALALLVGGGALMVRSLRGGTPPEHAAPEVAAGSRGAAPPVRAPIVRTAVGDVTASDAPAAAPAGRPGQARATVERAALPGGALSGRVVNWSTAAGVGGAELTFDAPAGAVTVRARDDGSFELAPPGPGTYTLATATAPGFLPYAPEWQHSTVRVELARDRRVRGVTVFLFPALDYHGKVVDAHGAPVAGAHVRLLGTPSGEQAIDRLATEWTTDAAGAFTFHAADDAVLEARAAAGRGWAKLDGQAAITHALTITLGDAAARDRTITGHVVDGAGRPLGDVLVSAMPAAEPDAHGGWKADVRATAFATSAPDGSFTLADLDDGRYDLAADDPDRAPARLAAVTGGARDVTLAMLDGAALAGAVVDGDGAPVPAFTLLVSRREGAARTLIVARSVVDAAGAFAVAVPPGDYELIASAAGWAPTAPTPARAGGDKVTLRVSAGAVLRGTVVSRVDGKPVAYARVMRETSGGGASAQPANAGTVTAEDGTFELRGLPPGPVSITVSAGDFHPRIVAGLQAADGAELGPLAIDLAPVKPGEAPTLELVGIGVGLAADGDALRVTQVIPGGGAEAAGLVVGDRIVTVDGAAVTALGLEGAIARIRGNPGTSVAIALARGDKIVPVLVERRTLHT